jgi:hypothetical protein
MDELNLAHLTIGNEMETVVIPILVGSLIITIGIIVMLGIVWFFSSVSDTWSSIIIWIAIFVVSSWLIGIVTTASLASMGIDLLPGK